MPKYSVEIYNCYSLHVRKYGNASSAIVAYVQKGQKFTSSKQLSNGWVYIDEKKGWSNGKYVKKLKRLDVVTQAKPTAPKAPPKAPSTTDKVVTPPKVNIDELAKAAMTQYIATGFVGATFTASNLQAMVDQSYDYDSTQAAADESDFYIPTGAQSTAQLMEKLDIVERSDDEFGATMMGSVITNGVDAPAVNVSQNEMSKAGAIHDYSIDTSFLDKQLETIRRNLNIAPYSGNAQINLELTNHFNRFKINYPSYFLGKTFGHVFFTRPDMHFYTNDGAKLRPQIESDMVFKAINSISPDLLKSLTRHYADHSFHPFLSNTAASFEIPDEFIKTLEHGETFVGHKIQYGRNNIEANNAGTFNINYTDDNRYSIYQLHKAWTDYISKVSRGEIDLKYTSYRSNKILDYTCSVYFILCGPDNETVLFWTKYFGVFPTTTPSSAASWTKGSPTRNPDVNITYAYSMKEDYNLTSLAEFNVLSGTSGTTDYVPVYATTPSGIGVGEVGRTMVGAPFIEKIESAGTGEVSYKLRFRNRPVEN